eukprot:CAMPEP_0176343924 /NCGR_PEP_ID=MMETSP0126-20121128/4293_1 /TAXON_ID=141414 ORGANISM="Strombidinopsis acuminatum, Strain SPMC142" /NCGR_SAMPLE_ID=MMETSP0126 /ASSEMBLY_ACC=CAM_ASM_000229 /LENGTH=92 /DNA_ID=CAMNT_0017690085 /DNA_START=1342 /DNA_END=1620 /DNA_ORIENTATION=-
MVHQVQSNFGTDVASKDTIQALMGFHISYLDEEELHTIIFSISNKSGSDYGVSGCDSQITSPEFYGIVIRSVENNLLGFRVECGSGLKCLHI